MDHPGSCDDGYLTAHRNPVCYLGTVPIGLASTAPRRMILSRRLGVPSPIPRLIDFWHFSGSDFEPATLCYRVRVAFAPGMLP